MKKKTRWARGRQIVSDSVDVEMLASDSIGKQGISDSSVTAKHKNHTDAHADQTNQFYPMSHEFRFVSN